MREIRAEVSCPPCCGGEQACCMYPAAGLAGGFYGASDLPDEVTSFGVTYPRSSTSYGNIINGIIFEANTWAKYVNGQRSEQPCLISNGVLDEFLESYTIDFNYNAEDSFIIESVVVYRESLCIWRGEDQCGNPVQLQYISVDFSVEGTPSRLARWTIDFPTNTLRDEQPCSTSTSFVIEKTPPNNSPSGTYGDYGAGVGALIT